MSWRTELPSLVMVEGSKMGLLDLVSDQGPISGEEKTDRVVPDI